MAEILIEVAAHVEDAISALYGVESGAGKLGKAINQDASGALSTFGVNLSALNSPLTLVAQTLKAAIDTTTQFANSIDEVQRITGGTAEETSKLLTVLGDYGVGVGTVKQAAKAMKDEGLTPSLDTLKKLAKEYQSIQDPVARTEWGTKKLGRAYFDLAEILSKTPAEFDALSSAAMRSGKVMSQEGVDKAQAFSLQLEQLKDKATGAALAIGGPLVDTLSTAATSFDELSVILAVANINYNESVGAIDAVTAAQARAAAAGVDLAPTIEMVATNYDREDRAAGLAAAAVDKAAKAHDDLVTAAANTPEALAAVEAAAQAEKDALDGLNFMMGEVTKQTLYHQAAQGLDAQASQALAGAMGLLNTDSVTTLDVLAKLKLAQDAGALSAGGYGVSVAGIDSAIAALHDKKITVTVDSITNYIDTYRKEFNAEFNTQTQKVGGEARASGGPVTGGQSYMVGEQGPETFVPNSSGAIIPHGAAAGGDTFNITVNDQASAGLLLAMIDERRRDSLNAFMGVQ